MDQVTHGGNEQIIEDFWGALYDRDFDRIASFFAPEATYTDIGTPIDDLAVGPQQICDRLRLGIASVDDYSHTPGLVVSNDDTVITEHQETWRWNTGESVTLPFVSVHVISNGLITRWTDYWDLQTLLGAAPAWWIDKIAAGYV